MKHVELINCTHDTKCGNHRVEIEKGVKNLIYYATIIVKVNEATRTYKVISEKISRSTSCAIGKYKNYLNARGYKFNGTF
jgi:hypothetical protein